MIATQCNTKPTTSQQEQIRRALIVAISNGWIEWESVEDPLSPEDEYTALTLLGTYRAKLKKLGVVFPTKAEYQDRLDIEPITAESWIVTNLTKGTAYEVTLAGLRLDCTCSKWGGGWCKHREAVEAWRDVHGADVAGCDLGMANDGSSSAEKLKTPGIAQIARNFLDTALTAPVEIFALQVRTYDFTPYWTAPFPPSEEQTAALQAMAAWWDGGDPIFRLTGSAGTGKSTTVQAFIKWLKARTLPPKIAMSAPINKAVKVQRKILREWGLADIQTHTCAQLFGVRRSVDSDGTEVFSVDPKAYPYYQDYGVIGVDEGGTINEQLWGMLLDATHDLLKPTRFIIMGDPAQLPPINEGESMAFRHDCPSAHLSTVQRYDGSIAVLADDVRLNLDRPVFPAFTTDTDPETKKGIYAVDRATWEAIICKVFTGDAYRSNPDHAKILTYTNRRVDALNILVRNALGYRAPWVIGERIIAKKPYAPTDGMTVLTTSDEATITGICEGFTSGVECWFLTLSTGDTIPVPRHPTEFEKRLKELQRLKQHGKYWALKESMADIAYAYALTVHNSQGSTYGMVFGDVTQRNEKGRPVNFGLCKGSYRTKDGQRILERNQLLYVLLTRASDRLIITA